MHESVPSHQDPQHCQDKLTCEIVKNDENCQSMDKLIQLKEIFVKQLPKISPLSFVRNMFDGQRESLVIMNERGEVLCGATFQVYEEVSMCDIFYLATKDKYQGKKIGSKLMVALKVKMQKRKVQYLVTHSDLSAQVFYYRHGFIHYSQKQIKDEGYSWRSYLQDFNNSVVLVHEIHPDMDYENSTKIVKCQYEGLIKLLSEINYRGFKFSREECQEVSERRIEQYFQNKGQNYNLFKENKKFDQQKFKQFKQSTLKSAQLQCQLQQIALFEKIKNHKNSWLLNYPFVHIPIKLSECVSKVVTLDTVFQNILGGKYLQTDELCAQLIKMITTLKIILPKGTGYQQNLWELQTVVDSLIESVRLGTFDLNSHYLGEEKDKKEGEKA